MPGRFGTTDTEDSVLASTKTSGNVTAFGDVGYLVRAAVATPSALPKPAGRDGCPRGSGSDARCRPAGAAGADLTGFRDSRAARLQLRPWRHPTGLWCGRERERGPRSGRDTGDDIR